MRELARQKINWLAVFIPLSFALNYVPAWQNELLLFWFSVLGLIVTSAWIGTATEQLPGRIGVTWGGMMNAGFGNLPELIFGLIAIRNGLGPLAKAAWTGAIVSNILVVKWGGHGGRRTAVRPDPVLHGARTGCRRQPDDRVRRRIPTVDLRRVSPPSADAADVHRLCGGNLHRSLRPAPDPLRCRNGSHRAA